MRRSTAAGFSALVLSAAILSGCAPGDPGDDDGEPLEPGPAASGEQPCEVGFWLLDVAGFAAQSASFLEETGIPVEGFAMTGDGNMEIGPDGVIQGGVSLTSTGTIVAGPVTVPFTTPSAYTFSGNWALGEEEGTLDLSNWATVPDPAVEADPGSPEVPAIDFTDIPSVSSECTADSLRLQGPDAPLSALFQRSS